MIAKIKKRFLKILIRPNIIMWALKQSVEDPFCGVGTVLAVANTLGLDALGVEKSRKRCEQARALVLGADEL